MVNFSYILDLPEEDFLEYFAIQNQLTYLQAIIKELEISTEKKENLEKKIKEIQGSLNYEKGKRYELLVFKDLLKAIISQKGGIVDGIKVTDLDFYINYCLKSGEDIDIVIKSSKIIIAVECKNYEKENISKINKELVDKFITKYQKLAEDYPEKEIRPLFISQNGFTDNIKDYLMEKGIPTSI